MLELKINPNTMQKAWFQRFHGKKSSKLDVINKNINVSLFPPNCLVWFRES